MSEPRPSVSVVRSFQNDTLKPALEELAAIVGHREQIVAHPAVVMMTCISLQEMNLSYRRQLVRVDGELKPVGRGRGLWSFEQPTMLLTLEHEKCRKLRNYEQVLARWFKGPPALPQIITQNDEAAAVMARLLLWTDNRPLLLDPAEMLEVYHDVWRPAVSARRPDDWFVNWDLALKAYPERPWTATRRGAGIITAALGTAATLGPEIVAAATKAQAVDALPPWLKSAAAVAIVGGLTLTAISSVTAYRRNGG